MSRPTPFGSLRPAIVLAAAYALATAVWMVAGRVLPGGRWLAIHLFTLGVVTNLVLSLSQHFARSLTQQRGPVGRTELIGANVGTAMVLWGMPAGARWAVATGAAVVTGAVLVSYVRLRRVRKGAPGARFTWIVRTYERAHGAFVHGALLGVLLGTGLLSGAWYLPARIAHLHVNVLGWAGLTLLATLAFFGPAMVRTRIEHGGDARAGRALGWAATGLTVGVLALLGTGVGAAPATALRLLAAGALGVYATAVGVACLPVARAAMRAKPSARRPLVVALVAWFIAVAWADVLLVATGTWRYLDALGVALLAGVLGQAILASLGYLAPTLRRGDRLARERMRARLERGGMLRAIAWNAGVMLAVGGTAAGPHLAWVARAGWALVIAAALTQAGATLAPLPRTR